MSRVLNLMMWQLFKKLQHNLSYSLYFIVYWLTRATRSLSPGHSSHSKVYHQLSPTFILSSCVRRQIHHLRWWPLVSPWLCCERPKDPHVDDWRPVLTDELSVQIPRDDEVVPEDKAQRGMMMRRGGWMGVMCGLMTCCLGGQQMKWIRLRIVNRWRRRRAAFFSLLK